MTTSYEPSDWSVERDSRGHHHLIFQRTERVARAFAADGALVMRVHAPHLIPAQAAVLLLAAAGALEQWETLSGLYNGIGIQTDAGLFGVCQRDGGIEIHLDDGPWYRWVDQSGPHRVGPDGPNGERP